MNTEEKIKLTASTKKDLNIISYLCQDAIFSKEELFFDKEKKVFITYINQLDQKLTSQLETFEESIITKYLNFDIKNFNSLDNQTFETDFLINYYVQA